MERHIKYEITKLHLQFAIKIVERNGQQPEAILNKLNSLSFSLVLIFSNCNGKPFQLELIYIVNGHKYLPSLTGDRKYAHFTVPNFERNQLVKDQKQKLKLCHIKHKPLSNTCVLY